MRYVDSEGRQRLDCSDEIFFFSIGAILAAIVAITAIIKVNNSTVAREQTQQLTYQLQYQYKIQALKNLESIDYRLNVLDKKIKNEQI